MKITVVGAGYVGLTTAACLAQIGHHVFCSESNLEKLAQLQAGEIPLFEPHLKGVIQLVREAGRLRFGSTNDAVAWCEAIFICVGTPPLANGLADLSAIEAAARTVAKLASGYRLIVEKSTVPVQTGAQLRRHLSVYTTNGLRYDVASNPEFLREGNSIEDFLHPDRIVIGVDSPRAEQLMREIYEPVIQQRFTCPVHKNCTSRVQPKVLVTDTGSAELIKHASNSFLAMKISFINMVANLCEIVGADVTKVAQGVGLDPRIGPAFLNPGIGFGGFCFPKDLQAFIRIAEDRGCDFSLLKEVDKINQHRVQYFVEKIRKELWVVRGKKIALWGLAFKPNTDDIRFAPSLALINALLAEGAVVSAYDPHAMAKAKAVIPEIRYCADAYEAASGADAIVIVTEWEEFRHVDWKRLLSLVEQPLVVDGRNVFSPEDISRQGFRYLSVGRVDALPSNRTSVMQRDASVQTEKGLHELSI